MYTKIIFPNRDLLIDFEDELNSKNLLHNYSSNYSEFSFEKKDIPSEILEIAKKYFGKINN